jgi:hypothetical protein
LYLCDGKIETFNCYVGLSIMFAQMCVPLDFASAVSPPSPRAELSPFSKVVRGPTAAHRPSELRQRKLPVVAIGCDRLAPLMLHPERANR